MINHRPAAAFAEQKGTELHWYHGMYTHKRVVVTDRALIEKLEGQHSGQTGHRPRRVPLVVGMPVAVNQNFDVAAGVVNRSHGILRKIRYLWGDEGTRYLECCVVEIWGLMQWRCCTYHKGTSPSCLRPQNLSSNMADRTNSAPSGEDRCQSSPVLQ